MALGLCFRAGGHVDHAHSNWIGGNTTGIVIDWGEISRANLFTESAPLSEIPLRRVQALIRIYLLPEEASGPNRCCGVKAICRHFHVGFWVIAFENETMLLEMAHATSSIRSTFISQNVSIHRFENQLPHKIVNLKSSYKSWTISWRFSGGVDFLKPFNYYILWDELWRGDLEEVVGGHVVVHVLPEETHALESQLPHKIVKLLLTITKVDDLVGELTF